MNSVSPTTVAAPPHSRAVLPDRHEDIEPEIRIEQSVHLVGQLPTLIVGNCIGALVAFLFAVDHVPWTLSLLWAWIPVTTIPMAFNWIKLRRKPRPARVSERRIRLAAWHSLVLGISWAVITIACLPFVPETNQALMLMGNIVLCAGAVASISALPYSAMAYFMPMMSMVFYISAFHGHIPYKPVALLSGLMFVAMFGFLRQNWSTFRNNVAVAVERARLVEQQREEVARRAAVERELRAAKDAAIASAEEVRAGQHRLQSIIEAMPLPLAIFRYHDAQTLYANAWAAELVKLDVRDMLERKSTEFFAHPDDGVRIVEGLRTGRAIANHEMMLKRSDGTAVPVRLASILMEYDGEKAILAAVEDITLRKQHEEQIERARHAAEDASRAKSQFFANMSHELRTPLNAVLGYAELMADGVYGPLPEKVSGVLGRIQHNGRHLLDLVNDVLDLSKIEAGQLTLRNEPYNWASIIQSAVTGTESLAKAKSLELRSQIESGLPRGRGDSKRLMQVMVNLIGNAIKFTDKGHVEVRARRGNDYFEIEVADTGPGIAAKDQERIFEEFQQVDSTSTRKKGGTGLGLAISRRIIELHGGRLGVRSKLGAGATFFMLLPIESAARPGETWTETQGVPQ